jgi:LCP family protein required for cell wall assembly
MWKRFLLAAVVCVALTAVATATAGLLEVNEVARIIRSGQPAITGLGGTIDRAEAGQPQTILLLGSDRRYIDIKQKNPSRSDTIILVRLDPDKDATTVMSLPRDLKIEIPGHGTDKINAAYAVGGPALTVKTVKSLLHIPINHVVNLNFGGFQRAVNRIGCVFTDVDRRYFNDNSYGPDYAVIDIKPGYQKLCGSDALDYVRYRHEDNDLIRSARQQDFIRQAIAQLGQRGFLSLGRLNDLTKIAFDYTQTDIRDTQAILRLAKLAILSSNHPIQEVHFPAEFGSPNDPYVHASDAGIQRAVKQFLAAKASKGARGKVRSTAAERRAARKRKKRRIVTAGLEDAKSLGQNQAVAIAPKLPFPVYYPRLRTPGAVYSGIAPRTYSIRAPGGKLYRAYRMVIKKGVVGEYYGVQGTNWMDPLILQRGFDKLRMVGRDYHLFYDGSRLRLISWKTSHAVYWVSNTLALTIPNKQMLAIARSLSRVGT